MKRGFVFWNMKGFDQRDAERNLFLRLSWLNAIEIEETK